MCSNYESTLHHIVFTIREFRIKFTYPCNVYLHALLSYTSAMQLALALQSTNYKGQRVVTLPKCVNKNKANHCLENYCFSDLRKDGREDRWMDNINSGTIQRMTYIYNVRKNTNTHRFLSISSQILKSRQSQVQLPQPHLSLFTVHTRFSCQSITCNSISFSTQSPGVLESECDSQNL